VPAPELIVVSGDLTEAARPREIDQGTTFLTGLRVLLGLEDYAKLFAELYRAWKGLVFDVTQPWTLFAVPELRVAPL
jgi:hypothetical protein